VKFVSLSFSLGLLFVLAFAGAADVRAADVRVVTLSPSEDVSFPYQCSWGYDADERCYRDDSSRLPVGGVDDGAASKVWRAALRFPLAALPPHAVVLTAELALRYDGVCVAPRRRTRPCDGRGFEFEAHPVFTDDWSSVRELEYGPAVSWASLDELSAPDWVIWDVTDLVADWLAGVPNRGVLLQLDAGLEDFAVAGPAFPSSVFPESSVRPRLTVWYQLE